MSKAQVAPFKSDLVKAKLQSIEQLLEAMWVDYLHLNPEAESIYSLLTQQGEKVLNDHIALRTFNRPEVGLQTMARVFEKFGYVAKGEYHFQQKKLYAQHFENVKNPSLPKIFISELLVEQMSPLVQKAVDQMLQFVTTEIIQSDYLSMIGRPWKMSHETFLALAKESEYASWVAAHGFRPNHFTVSVNSLKKYSSLESLNQFLEGHSKVLNSSGGKIKGTPAELLEQSSTMAANVHVMFEEGSFEVPGCYYEFARRYAMPSGQLYQGFIAKSADKIFESTNKLS
jgi:hypothetical protein